MDASPSDAELVSRARQHPPAFEPLYIRYRDLVNNYCFYRLGDRTEADDAASAVFLKALSGLPGFQGRDGSFRTWLFRIAHNEVVDRFRRSSRHPESSLDEFNEANTFVRPPEEEIIERDAQSRVLELLKFLPPRERAVLELRIGDLTTPEIAAVLGITEQNVRTAQSRGVAHMRELVSDGGVSGDEGSNV